MPEPSKSQFEKLDKLLQEVANWMGLSKEDLDKRHKAIDDFKKDLEVLVPG